MSFRILLGALDSSLDFLFFAFANHIFLKGFFTSATLFQFGANIQILLDLSTYLNQNEPEFLFFRQNWTKIEWLDSITTKQTL